MQMPLLKNNHGSKLFTIIVLLSLLSGCKKNDPFPQIAAEESADVVFDWYKLISRIQRNTTPPPVVLQNLRNFGFIGVGLYESVQPGITCFPHFIFQKIEMQQYQCFGGVIT